MTDVSIHNDYPWNEYFDHNTHLIGIMYAGRTPDDKADDVIRTDTRDLTDLLMELIKEKEP